MEQILNFGSNNALVGIVSLPENSQQDTEKPACILLNAGLVHRAGPYRMNVELSRFLAKAGFISLRFDLSGIGDSANDNSDLDYELRVIDDIKNSLDILNERFSVKRFVLFGLCTGADNAHKAAVQDERIIGSIFLDGYAYPSLKYYVLRYGPGLLKPKKIYTNVFKIIKKILPKSLRSKQETLNEFSEISTIFNWDLPPRNQALTELLALSERGVRMLFIFSGGVIQDYIYKDQIFDSLPPLKKFRNQIDVEVFNLADHTYMLVSDRHNLYKRIQHWLTAVG